MSLDSQKQRMFCELKLNLFYRINFNVFLKINKVVPVCRYEAEPYAGFFCRGGGQTSRGARLTIFYLFKVK